MTLSKIKKIAQRTAIGLLAAVVLVNCSLWLTSPWLLRKAMAEALASHGVQVHRQSHLRLNLFNLSLSATDVLFSKDRSTTYELSSLKINLTAWPLLFKRLAVKDIEVDGMKALLRKEADLFSVIGIHLQPSAPGGVSETPLETEPSAFSLSLPAIRLKNVSVVFINEQQVHLLQITSLAIHNTQITAKALASDIQLHATLDGIQFDVLAEFSGPFEDIQFEMAIDIDGEIPDTIRYLLPENIQKLAAQSQLELQLDGQMTSSELSFNRLNAELAIDEMQFIDEQFQLGFAELRLALTHNEFSLALANNALIFDMDIASHLSGLSLSPVESNNKLLAIDKISVPSLRVFAESERYSAQIDEVSIQQLLLSQVDSQSAMFAVDAIVLQNTLARDTGVVIQDLSIAQSQLQIERDSNGSMPMLVSLPSRSAEKNNLSQETTNQPLETTQPEITAPSGVNTAPQTNEFDFVLKRFQLTQPMQINIDDKSNNHDFIKSFSLSEFELLNLDSTQPNVPATFRLVLQDADYFESQTTGWVKPFTQEVSLALEGTAKEFPLHEVAPYLRDSLGFEVNRGLLDADWQASVNRNELDGEVNLKLKGAKFSSSQRVNKETNLVGKTAIPLDMALGLLRDSNDDIKLKVPVSGALDDPSFNLNHIIGTVIKNIALSQAKKQLTNALIPYAQVVSVAFAVGEQALKVRFEDLIYTPAQTELADVQVDFVTQFSALLADKQDLRVSLCPVGTPADLGLAADAQLSQAQYDELLQIAQTRAKLLKDYLVTAGQIDSAQLLLCSPKMDSGEKSQPRIEFET